MKLYQKFFENSKRWSDERKAIDNNYFSDLSGSQNPEILHISCSDSRVTAEEVTGVKAEMEAQGLGILNS